MLQRFVQFYQHASLFIQSSTIKPWLLCEIAAAFVVVLYGFFESSGLNIIL